MAEQEHPSSGAQLSQWPSLLFSDHSYTCKKCRIDLGIGLFRSKIHHARPDAISLLLHNLLLVQIQFVVFERCKHFGSKTVICG